MSKTGPAPMPIPTSWRPTLDAYLACLAAAGCPRTTRATRTGHLRRVAYGLGVSPQDVTGASLVEFFARQEQWARETRRGYRNSCVSFFTWAHREGHIPTNPSLDLPSVKPAAPAPRPAPDRVYREALMAAGPREMVMLRLAAEAGLRRAEVAVVNTADLDESIDGYRLVVHGKGGKIRTVPITDELAALIAAGAAGHTPGAPATGWLFPGDEDGHLSPRWVGKLCGSAMSAGWTLHKLRHRFATRAYRGTHNLRAVQTLMGHASVATTEIYTAVDDAEVREAMMAASDRTTAGRIAGALGAVAAAAMLVFGLMGDDLAFAVEEPFTPQEQRFLATLTAYPNFSYRGRTRAELVGFAREACRIHDRNDNGFGAGDSAALHWLNTNPRVRRPAGYWNTAATTMCFKSPAELVA